jgi:hypothetical protein
MSFADTRIRTVAERFWAKVNKNTPSGCWEWTAYRNPAGYGVFGLSHDKYKGPSVLILAHRMSWTMANGPIPKGQYVLHRCDNPSCVNPEHLWLGSIADNQQDMSKKGRSRSGGPSGEENGNARLTREVVREIRSRKVSEGLSAEKLSAIYHVAASTIRQIVRGETWKEG